MVIDESEVFQDFEKKNPIVVWYADKINSLHSAGNLFVKNYFKSWDFQNPEPKVSIFLQNPKYDPEKKSQLNKQLEFLCAVMNYSDFEPYFKNENLWKKIEERGLALCQYFNEKNREAKKSNLSPSLLESRRLIRTKDNQSQKGKTTSLTALFESISSFDYVYRWKQRLESNSKVEDLPDLTFDDLYITIKYVMVTPDELEFPDKLGFKAKLTDFLDLLKNPKFKEFGKRQIGKNITRKRRNEESQIETEVETKKPKLSNE